ncbi:MAG: glycosyl hydrolase, partial [Rhodothermales bacterium]|nr:glycosyl hydrolase [Rhodothermales bacterium]
AANVAWVWSPNVVSVPDTPDNDMHRYYPGDAYVDWVGLDGYNFGDHHDEWHRWQSFAEVFEAPLAELESRFPRKPVHTVR